MCTQAEETHRELLFSTLFTFFTHLRGVDLDKTEKENLSLSLLPLCRTAAANLELVSMFCNVLLWEQYKKVREVWQTQCAGIFGRNGHGEKAVFSSHYHFRPFLKLLFCNFNTLYEGQNDQICEHVPVCVSLTSKY